MKKFIDIQGWLTTKRIVDVLKTCVIGQSTNNKFLISQSLQM